MNEHRTRKNIDRDDERVWNTNIQISLSGYQRRLINSYYGLPGMATLATCRSFIESNGKGALDDLDYDAQQVGMPGEEGYDLMRHTELRALKDEDA